MLRLLEMFNELAEEAVTVAQAPATELLTARFKEVEKEIVAAFNEHTNPLQEAADALLQRYDRQIQREGRKTAETLPALQAAIEAVPKELAEIEGDAA
jgi:hypothetical protein